MNDDSQFPLTLSRHSNGVENIQFVHEFIHDSNDWHLLFVYIYNCYCNIGISYQWFCPDTACFLHISRLDTNNKIETHELSREIHLSHSYLTRTHNASARLTYYCCISVCLNNRRSYHGLSHGAYENIIGHEIYPVHRKLQYPFTAKANFTSSTHSYSESSYCIFYDSAVSGKWIRSPSLQDC